MKMRTVERRKEMGHEKEERRMKRTMMKRVRRGRITILMKVA